MSVCPKCHGSNIIGPKFHPAMFPRYIECLGYTCATCGYSTTTPTKDAKPSPSLPQEPTR